MLNIFHCSFYNDNKDLFYSILHYEFNNSLDSFSMLLKITMLMYLILADQTAVIAAVEQVGKLVTAIISTEIATAIISKVMEKKTV